MLLELVQRGIAVELLERKLDKASFSNNKSSVATEPTVTSMDLCNA